MATVGQQPSATPKSKRSRPSFGGFLGSTPKDVISSPSKFTSEDRKRSFEEWLKIAADNKINGQNTWNLNLIDYFADMSLLRDGDSINFQKASFTLDGCVKVYTSRIDSVDTETKKLLMGLVEKETDQPEAGDGNAENNPTKRRKQLAKTLSDNQSLSMETLELDFAADPLFQKTAADFDEGGAKGLLLSHLDISSDGRIIFDASDVFTAATHVEEYIECDIVELQNKFSSRLSNIHSQLICPTFSNFQFNSNEVNEEYTVNVNRDDFYYEPVADLSGDEMEGGYDEGAVYDDGPVYDGPAYEAPIFITEERDATELVEETMIKMVKAPLIKSEENMFSYFDKLAATSWAGPEFWKARTLKKPLTEKSTRAPSKKKEKVCINFSSRVDPKVLFAKTKTSTLLPKSKLSDTFLLPQDYQYNSEKFTRLFLRPSFSMQEFKQKIEKASTVQVKVQSGHRTSFGSNANAEHTEFNSSDYHNAPFDEPVYAGFDDDDEEPSPQEYPANFILPSDNFQESAVDKPEFGFPQQQEYGDQLLPELLRPKAKPLMFAKSAKRVDVQKLKENLWTKLADEETPNKSMEIVEAIPEKKFTQLVSEMDQCYSEKSRKDISVAFCFICVLHLANENNLKIHGDPSMNELIISS